MSWLRRGLRVAGVAGVVGGLLDPGCTEARRPVLDVQVLEGVPDADARVARLAAAAPWAEVRREGIDTDRATPPAAARVVVGDAGRVLTALHDQGAALAIRPGGDALALARLSAPVQVAVGSRCDVIAMVTDLPSRRGRVRVRLLEVATNAEVAVAESAPDGTTARVVAVNVPWIPSRAGHVRLRAVADWVGEGEVRSASPADLDVWVRDVTVAVDVLEARPSWSARFARLALEGARGLAVRNETRVAPGLTTGADAPRRDDADGDVAAISVVGGVDALTTRDVARLATDVRLRGRTVILVLDELPSAGPWTALWPHAVGPTRSTGKAMTARVGRHAWHVREWLEVRASTDAHPLAYLDEDTPVIWGRASGAGRVVLVTALDAWRWRADADTDFAGGWRALVTSLALEQPAALSLRPWLGHTADGRVLDIAATAAPGSVVDEVRVTADPADGAPGPLALWSSGPGRWRGVAAWPTGPRVRLVAGAVRGGRVVAEDAAVIDVSPPALVGGWPDVARRQAERGALAASDAETPRALSDLRAALAAPPGDRWHATRTWWYAALVLGALGLEWILRRLHRER